ncbi:HIT zinc finger [Dictyocaulus viviparus]|uniref:HIT zinc finger n=1 Tax=Dictyocaulus viviparus TaxID=29172 RepID=A0A0D8XPA5_DICVI|nr:HIT zinc finger [Dictyocaulus viviparus]
MEVDFLSPPSCVSRGVGEAVVVGFMDGIVQYATYDTSRNVFQTRWKFQTKASVRGIAVNHIQSEVLAVTSNKGISCFDIETGKRKRCIKRGHDDKPTSICFPQNAIATKSQHFYTGDETGEIRTWDFQADVPAVCSWREQQAVVIFNFFLFKIYSSIFMDVNALKLDYRSNLLSVSADATLAAYDVRKRRLRMKSEMMHSELVSLCVTDKYVYAGGRDGYLEVFVHGDYGNIIQRIETEFDMGVDDVVELRKGLLMTCSGSSDNLKYISISAFIFLILAQITFVFIRRLMNVMPTTKLGTVGTHGDEDGVDQLVVTMDGNTLVSLSTFGHSIKFWSLAGLLKDIPILRAVDIKKNKKKHKSAVKDRFFDDLVETKSNGDAEEDDQGNFFFWMIRCAFCSLEKREQYKCPRCGVNYCSLRCYRNQKHAECSESFYKDCIKEHLEGQHFERNGHQDTFEERMQKYLDGELDEIPGKSLREVEHHMVTKVHFHLGASTYGYADDECEVLDSDDETECTESSFRKKEDQYLEKVVANTIDDYVLDEDEIDRRLLGLGVGGEVDQLMGVLSEEERATFVRLAEEIHIDTSGLGDSCFRKEEPRNHCVKDK